MKKQAMWKWLLLIVLTAWSLVLVTPFKDKVKLGLDLKGGTSFTVEVDQNEVRKQILEGDAKLEDTALESAVQAAVKKTQGVALEVLRSRVDGLGIAEPEIYPQLDDRIVIRLPGVDANKRAEAKASILSVAFLEFRLVHPESDVWVGELFSTGLTPSGFSIVRDGSQQYYKRDQNKPIERALWEELKRFGNKRGAEFMLEKETLRDGSIVYRPAYIEVRKQLTGSALKDARVEFEQQNNQPYVSLSFNKAGAERFGKVTADYAPRGQNNLNSDTGRRLAIILDGKLYSAPTIQDAIYSGNAQITGSFTVDECTRLVNVLRAGALPAPVTIIEERTVDPSLGKDSIDKGIRASIYGSIGVFAFMAGYYFLAGMVANISLLLVIILLPFGMWFSSGILSLFSAGAGAMAGLPVLTMPGIAGIALTIGMAVDANVLIYERMREELEAGKSLRNAISAGYDKAFSAIFDSNLTTLLTAVILFWQGSGPVRGFAVTLTAGIIVSMFVVLVFTRLLLNLLADKTNLKTMKMMQVFKNPNYDFLGKRVWVIGISIAIIVGTWAVFLKKGQDNFGVDFTGGTSITFAFNQKQAPDAVRAVLDQAGVRDARIQYQKELDPTAQNTETLEVKVSGQNGDEVIRAIESAFGTYGYHNLQANVVGPQIGAELKKSGLVALTLALLGIIIYLAVRFEFGFAAGAVVAVVHDVIITVGIYCLLGRQLSLTTVAALLTIIGYSVNDTIVVFDRIREDIRGSHGKPYVEVANRSINRTLSRTLLTGVSTQLTIISLMIFGGGDISDFALILFIGIAVGTFSSVYIATPVALLWHKEEKV
ncbi:MAG: protein translocase subunit SecD [Kiritimatiellaceae bacterium]|nr:protein translocase subunit SecD [Kiritimatiellaceae bacterium]